MTEGRKTKIIATIGPATDRPETLVELIEAGADILRVPLDVADPYSTAELLRRVRRVARECRDEVAILGDLPRSASLLAFGRPNDLDRPYWAIAEELDLLAVPGDDLAQAATRLSALCFDLSLVAKIDSRPAVARIEDILGYCAGLLIAREPLGDEFPPAELPGVQKQLIRAAGWRSKPSIVAGEVLNSMLRSPRPTRAEATDVANAIYDGADAVMLSRETSLGEHPVEAVRVVDRIARATEPDLPRADWLSTRTDKAQQDVADAVAQSAVGAVYRLGLKALVVPTDSGRTARLVAAHRPKAPILAVSPRIETVRRLGLLAGVTATVAPQVEDTGGLLDQSARLARSCGLAAPGDLVGVTGGLADHGLGTNLFGVQRVP